MLSLQHFPILPGMALPTPPVSKSPPSILQGQPSSSLQITCLQRPTPHRPTTCGMCLSRAVSLGELKEKASRKRSRLVPCLTHSLLWGDSQGSSRLSPWTLGSRQGRRKILLQTPEPAPSGLQARPLGAHPAGPEASRDIGTSSLSPFL